MCRCITRDYRGWSPCRRPQCTEQHRLGSKTSQNDVFCSRSLTGSILRQSGPPCESLETPRFCSRSLLGSILSESCFSSGSSETLQKSDSLQNGNERKSSASYSIFERPGSPKAAPETPFLTPKKHNSRRRLTTKYLKYLRF